jgi:hypothetical protein
MLHPYKSHSRLQLNLWQSAAAEDKAFLLCHCLLATTDLQSTMSSSRRFGTSSELKLQKLLRGHETNIDASQIASPDAGDRSTRFDYDATQANLIRQEIDEKQRVCYH